MVAGEGEARLGCTYCGDIRFSRLTPPFSASSEVQCMGCGNSMKLGELTPVMLRDPPPQSQLEVLPSPPS